MSNEDNDNISDYCKNNFHVACKWPDCQCECHAKGNNRNKPQKHISYEEAQEIAFGKQERGEV